MNTSQKCGTFIAQFIKTFSNKENFNPCRFHTLAKEDPEFNQKALNRFQDITAYGNEISSAESVLEKLFLSYIKSAEFAALPDKDRLINTYSGLKEVIATLDCFLAEHELGAYDYASLKS